MSAQPVEQLELRALEQRRQIHASAEELKLKITAAKERLDPTRKLREHRFAAAMVIGGVVLVIGAVIARRFKR